MSNGVKDLMVYQKAFDAAVKIQKLSYKFPPHEIYALTKQIRCSSRSVCSNLSEGYRKRIYPKHFLCKLTDADMEANETVTWLDFAKAFGYITEEEHRYLHAEYIHIGNMLGQMEKYPSKFAPRSAAAFIGGLIILTATLFYLI